MRAILLLVSTALLATACSTAPQTQDAQAVAEEYALAIVRQDTRAANRLAEFEVTQELAAKQRYRMLRDEDPRQVDSVSLQAVTIGSDAILFSFLGYTADGAFVETSGQLDDVLVQTVRKNDRWEVIAVISGETDLSR